MLTHVFFFFPFFQPKRVIEVKNFLRLANRKDAKWVKIRKHREKALKFKVRTSKFLYTLIVNNKGRAHKLKKALPKELEVRVHKKSGTKKEAATA
jgi:large subunit ribosomal protein L38e